MRSTLGRGHTSPPARTLPHTTTRPRLTSRTFLALDLGGTNLRVCKVELDGHNTFEIKQQKYKVSEELKQGDAGELFGAWHGAAGEQERQHADNLTAQTTLPTRWTPS